MRQEMMDLWGFGDGSGIMQTTCTSLRTYNHTNTSSITFYRPDALPDAQGSFRAGKHRNAVPVLFFDHRNAVPVLFGM